MKMTPVDSSNLSAVGYDETTKTMQVRFNSGGLYAYYNVPEKTYRDLMKADSCGSYFNTFIKGMYGDAKIG